MSVESKRILGVCLLATPFLGSLFALAIIDNYETALIVFGIAAVILGFIAAGLSLVCADT